MRLKLAESTELILLNYTGGEYSVELTEKEIKEYKTIEDLFYKWQNRLKTEAKDKYGRHIYQKVD